MGNTNSTDGQAAVLVFDMWQELLINGKIPDCKRYHDEFFDFYKGYVKSDTSPFYLMFCAFVGAMDMNGLVEGKEHE